ncbi:NAD(P)-dependent oxidoreductase [Idiomarina tyrosinivorans]|uniref:NAD(P)-dependent oxidoreductase n=1 Tax=Idiomarina tyrosinivorans TaxID=1445662 RepID=A0A432ZTS0_9GAMM|nr:SDR family oxidoreductase [Idiomarina tyrosinivorans]RUO81218.1 NAD(P)-dependent oxidoreductase [Idiomarina tyrosinivorans]
MQVAVIGANGKVGQQIVEDIQQSPAHEVIACVRKESQQQALEERGVESRLLDLERSVGAIKQALKGCDAVVFSAGSGGSTGDDKTLLIDLDGAIKVIEASEELGVKRFVMVSALQANNRANWNDSLRPYYAAKHYADKALMASSLEWTVVRPGALIDEQGTGKIDLGNELQRGSITRADVAHIVARCLDRESTIYRGFDVVNGDTAIDDALRSL